MHQGCIPVEMGHGVGVSTRPLLFNNDARWRHMAEEETDPLLALRLKRTSRRRENDNLSKAAIMGNE